MAARDDGPQAEEDGGTGLAGEVLVRRTPAEPQFQRGQLLAERYQIEELIGVGATGCVLRAFDRVSRAVVAVKILKPELAVDPRWVERLGGELRYARRLQHPHVCHVYDVGASEGHHFLTMEYAAGGSLRQRLATPDRPLPDRLTDARAVIEGLAAIHSTDIVHRDVKPENVLVMEDGRLVLSDFGFAMPTDHTTYFSSKVAGTPSYMAPEVHLGQKATKASDVWSLGVLLHEIFFGGRPDWEMRKSGRVLRMPVDRKSSRRERALAQLCADCLTEFPPRRLADGVAVRERFEYALEGRARPPTLRIPRPWALAAAALAVVIVSAAAIIVRSPRQSVPKVRPVTEVRGTPADLGRMSRVVLRGDKPITCLKALPGGKTVRIVWGRPPQAVDVDVSTGQGRPAPLLPATYASGCPQLSPDGQSLLFTQPAGASVSQIMLSPFPDGREAQAVTAGHSPAWLPSSREFVFTADRRRAAVFSLPRHLLFFPDPPERDKTLALQAVSEQGDLVALVWRDAVSEDSVALHEYPSLSMKETITLPGRAQSLSFDPSRGRFVMSLYAKKKTSLIELSSGGDLFHLGYLDDKHLTMSARTLGGLLMVAGDTTREIFVRDREGIESRAMSDAPGAQFVVSDNGDLLFVQTLGDGRLAIALLPVGGTKPILLTEGPHDVSPSFAPDGRSFIFVRTDEGAVVHCQLQDRRAQRCREVLRDPADPIFPVLAPDESAVAYFATLSGAKARLHVRLRSGKTLDLGPHDKLCAPVWGSARTLWVYDQLRKSWMEIDPATRTMTGRVQSVDASEGYPCHRPPRSDGPRLRMVTTLTNELRVTDRL